MTRNRQGTGYLGGSPGFISYVQVISDRVASEAEFPFQLPAIAALHEKLALDCRATIFVGENGSGKSTLVEAIAVAAGFNAEGGTMNFRFASRSSESQLHRALRVTRTERRPRTGFFLRAESLFNVATHIEALDREPSLARPIIDSYGGKSLHELSHGESFLALVRHRFGANGLYILDEPEAALSPSRQLTLLSWLHELVTDGSQLIMATHSPILMALPNASIYALSESGIAPIEYEETEHFQVTKGFLLNPGAFLAKLLDPAEP